MFLSSLGKVDLPQFSVQLAFYSSFTSGEKKRRFLLYGGVEVLC